MVGRCELCGGPLPPKKSGTQRKYCSKSHKDIAARKRSDARKRGGVVPEHDPFLPIGPFRAYLLGRLKYYDSVYDLARMMGTHDRAIRRFLNEAVEVHVSTVDNLLVREGQMTLYELYPDHRPTGEEE